MKNKPSTILISSEHHNKLKELAAYDKRTIRAYIEVLIDNLSPPTATSSPAPKAPAPAQTKEDILAEWAD